MRNLLTILPCLFLMFQPLNAKVEAPNYDFSLETLNDFFPQKKLQDVKAKYGQGEVINNKHGHKTQRFYVTHVRYKFPVLVQEKDGTISDFFARLPNYFLHDIFLQSLVKLLGQQTTYQKTGEEAYYVWEQNDLIHVYSAACTITCFPIFYSARPKSLRTSLLEQMKSGSASSD